MLDLRATAAKGKNTLEAPTSSSDIDTIDSVERYFSTFDDKLSHAGRTITIISKALSALRDAVRIGDVVAISKYLEELGAAKAALDLSISGALALNAAKIEDAFRGESYFPEIADLARESGTNGVRSTEGKLFAYPFVIDRKKAGPALSLGPKTLKTIRPTSVVNAIVEARKRAASFDKASMLIAVENLYDVLVRGRETNLVAIDEIHDLLTSMPGSEKSLPFFDFLSLLDTIRRAGPVIGKSGRTLDFPPASTSGKGGKAHRIIREDGRELLYHMVRFVKATDSQLN